MQHHEEAWIYNGQKKVPPTVRRVRIAESLTEIPNDVFAEHQELEEVILSSSLQVIGAGAFFRCKKLKSIRYQGLEKEKVGIPSTVKVIGDSAFDGCTSLEELILNEGLERIGEWAFCRCESLTEVNVPSTVKVIGEQAFDHCKLLARLGLNEGLEQIGDSAFSSCESLTTVDIPSTVKVIGYRVFSSCFSLARLGLNEGLERIGEFAFDECESLTEVNVPSTVKVIDDQAFDHCNFLLRLGLNEGLEQIGDSAFSSCESLATVDIPSTVKVIGNSAFRECERLARLGLNEGLERIEEFAFFGCDSLSHVRIPQSVNIIATDAFGECSSMVSVELPEECSFNIELSRCLSLVSVVGPVSITFQPWQVRERKEFFQSSKLGSFVGNEADLIRKVNHRFDNSPLNKLCYYQSYQSLDDALARIHSMMEGGPPLAATTEVDEFGMTPLHVLSLSQIPNLDLLLAVMDAGKSGHMAHNRDSLGCTPMDYLCLNRVPNSSKVIRRLFQTRFDQMLGGLDKFWESDMLQAVDEALGGDWASRKSKIGEVVRKYAQKEILSLLELFLWKMKIGEATSKKAKIGEATSNKEHILADRRRCRTMSGADVVIPNVLPFLDS